MNVAVAAALIVGLGLAAMGLMFATGKLLRGRTPATAAPLNEAQRQLLLTQLRLWLDQTRGPSAHGEGVASARASEVRG